MGQADTFNSPELLDLAKWYDIISAKEWRNALEAGIDELAVVRLRMNTHTDRPLGSDGFLSKLEKLLGRRVRPLPIGRPKKNKKSMKSVKMGKKNR